MATAERPQNSVILLHKFKGRSLFQFESRPFPVSENAIRPVTSKNPSPRRNLNQSSQPVKPRVIVKCQDRQDANTMFAKRIQARTARHYKPPQGSLPAVKTTTNQQQSQQQPQCQFFMKERLFSNSAHKPAGFPPPNFMARWNPRRKDRTYMSKMILDDPWSLPPEKRRLIKSQTGLRLKSLSRQYQYKVRSQLPFGKEAMDGCTCYVNYCDHCTKKHHDFRCPLYMQLLDSWEPDCKTEETAFCPLSKNPEDLPLHQITDAGIYITEVERRLKAGEITKAPPLRNCYLIDPKKKGKLTKKLTMIEASNDAFDLEKKEVNDSCTQTEPFIVDVDMKAAFKDNICQTRQPNKDEPYVFASVLSKTQSSHYKLCPTKAQEASTQVTPCLIDKFNQVSGPAVRSLVKQTLQQSIQEISDEARLHQVRVYTAYYTQRLVDLERKAHFRFLREKFRHNAYQEELYLIGKETLGEKQGDERITVISFCQSYLYNFPGKVMDTLRRHGYVVDEDLYAMRTVVKDHLNELMKEKLRLRDESTDLLDEMIRHALLDLEIDAFRAHLVEEKYLDPLNWTTKYLRDLIVLQDDNLEMLRKIKARLTADNWYLNQFGELIPSEETPEQDLGTQSNIDMNLDAFLEGVRVSVDSNGKPKELVDAHGKPLPVQVKWTPTEGGEKEHKEKYFIILDENTVTTIKRSSRKSSDVLGETEDGEGLGLDFDYLGKETPDDDDDDDHDEQGRLVYRRKTELEDDDDFLADDFNM